MRHIYNLLYTGMHNTTFWAILAITALVLRRRLRGGRQADDTGSRTTTVAEVFGSPIFLLLVSFGSIVCGAYGLYKGYAVPYDFMQDYISAREYLEGRSLYPRNMTDMFVEAVEKEPPRFSLFPERSGLRQTEAVTRRAVAAQNWVQAHPPLMTLWFSLFVRNLGIYGTYFAINAASLFALAVMLILILRGLGLELSRMQAAALGFLILGWDPVILVFRSAQSGLLLGCLLTAGWYGLRRGWPIVAGVAIGIATCLKFYPGVVVFYLLIRHRRAFAASAVTILGLEALSIALTGWHSVVEHYHTCKFVIDYYITYPTNISLQALVARFARDLGLNSQWCQAAVAVLEVAMLLGIARLILSGKGTESEGSERMDLEYSLFVTLVPLMSPISWVHYLVLLVLPLSILGRHVLTRAASPIEIPAFIGLLLVLAVPDTTYTWLYEIMGGGVSRFALDTFLMSLRTFALIALAIWLATAEVASWAYWSWLPREQPLESSSPSTP